MKNVFKQIVWAIFAVVSLCPVATHTKNTCKNKCAKQNVSTKCFKHNIQLQLSDAMVILLKEQNFGCRLI